MEQHTLDNGLTVLINESHAHPLVTIDLWVEVGSAYEPEELAGVSHYLEHMLFKGTPEHKVGDIDRIVENMGGLWNAGTSRDYTHFYITVGSSFFEPALKILTDVVLRPSIDANEFERERSVILEEIRRKQDNPSASLWDETYARAYEKSPYKGSVLGPAESIKAMPHSGMLGYYAEHYQPGRMTLALVGDVETSHALSCIESVFDAALADRPAIRPKEEAGVEFDSLGELSINAVYASRGRTDLRRDTQEAYVAIAWPAAGMDQLDDVYPLDALATILGDGRTSRLYRTIREEKQLATAISCSYLTQKGPSLMVVVAATAPDKVDALIEAVEDEMERMRQDPVESKELDRVRAMLRNQRIFATETTSGEASLIGYGYTVSGGVEFEQTYLDRIEALNAGDLRRAAMRYLKPEHRVVTVILPQQTASEEPPAGESN
ncbi:insulinase family protein [Candidatus Sumerlaeota bacterium]|nr:insulinase family protein [Candidatus Sumerlaeota bacterium]